MIWTDELSSFGYCWTGSLVIARQPISTITRVTTIAMTGCRMKMSVNDRMSKSSSLGLSGDHGVSPVASALGALEEATTPGAYATGLAVGCSSNLATEHRLICDYLP